MTFTSQLWWRAVRFAVSSVLITLAWVELGWPVICIWLAVGLATWRNAK